jgi:microcystin-dependent protein
LQAIACAKGADENGLCPKIALTGLKCAPVTQAMFGFRAWAVVNLQTHTAMVLVLIFKNISIMLDGNVSCEAKLIQAFSDGKTPDGLDFRSLILSCINDQSKGYENIKHLFATESEAIMGMDGRKIISPLYLARVLANLVYPELQKLRDKDGQLSAVDGNLQTQINQSNANMANHIKDLHTSMLPIGSIIMWGLPLEQKPKNFVLCNGDEHIINGVKQRVPDLLGRFALGVGNGYGFKAMGGEYDVELKTEHMPSHSHTGTTVAAGEHNHKMNFIGTPRGGGSGYVMVDASTIDKPKPEWYAHTYNSGNHTHSFSTDATGGGQAHNNMPPYFGLYYLIKIAN